MVKISTLEKRSSKSKTTDAKTAFARRTHLFMHDKCISSIPKIRAPETLTVIYLHNNNISQIESLNAATNLKILNLHKNKISKVEGLEGLHSLRKLFLGHNEISVVEGLHNLNGLEELHVEKQRLKAGDSLCFDPRTVGAVADSLKVLNVSQNNIASLSDLSRLKRIEKIIANHNKLGDIKDVCGVMRNWYRLEEANFMGNPITKRIHYRENIIKDTFRLTLLDNKVINDMTRTFMKQLEREKSLQSSKQSLKLTIEVPDIAKDYPLPVQKAISRSILKVTKSCSDDIRDDYLPWRAWPKSNGGAGATNQLKLLQKRNVPKVPLTTTFPSLC